MISAAAITSPFTISYRSCADLTMGAVSVWDWVGMNTVSFEMTFSETMSDAVTNRLPISRVSIERSESYGDAHGNIASRLVLRCCESRVAQGRPSPRCQSAVQIKAREYRPQTADPGTERFRVRSRRPVPPAIVNDAFQPSRHSRIAGPRFRRRGFDSRPHCHLRESRLDFETRLPTMRHALSDLSVSIRK